VTSPQILSMPGSEDLGGRVAAALEVSAATVEMHRFPDGETRVAMRTDVAESVALVARLDGPDGRLVPALLAASAARARGACRVGLVAPYLPYMRQDVEFTPGEAVSARVVPALLRTGFDWLVTVDPHLHRIHDLAEVFRGDARAVASAPALAAWIGAHVAEPLVVGPDAESEQWVTGVAALLDAPHVVLSKVRRGDHDVEIRLSDAPLDRGRTPVVVDDLVSTAGTMIAGLRVLRDAGLPPAVCVGVHGLFVGHAYEELLRAGPASIATTDTVVHPTNAIGVAPLLADAVRPLLRG
jgi:ribose-phosphate pyrophosphokinase